MKYIYGSAIVFVLLSILGLCFQQPFCIHPVMRTKQTCPTLSTQCLEIYCQFGSQPGCEPACKATLEYNQSAVQSQLCVNMDGDWDAYQDSINQCDLAWNGSPKTAADCAALKTCYSNATTDYNTDCQHDIENASNAMSTACAMYVACAKNCCLN